MAGLPPRKRLAQALTIRLLAGVWRERAMLARLRPLLDPIPAREQGDLIRSVIRSLDGEVPPAPAQLVRTLLGAPEFDAISAAATAPPAPTLRAPAFSPAREFAELCIPRLATEGDVAAWLGISVSHLEWLADLRRNHASADRTLAHYRYRFIERNHGRQRLLEAPKPALKAIQRRILREILDAVPPPEHAHGFVRGRSALTGAARHAGEAVVVALDLADFFPSVPLLSVHRLFRRLGYPWLVARVLTGLCTTITPAGIRISLPDWPTRQRHAVPHLAQGAPTSPALANFAATALDRRLAGLARVLDANYSRYADDLAFSGDAAFVRRVPGFLRAAAEIIRDEGFHPNSAKTRIMPESGRQVVTGIIVNRHCNISRTEFDALKATLHDCVVNGFATANRSRHPEFRRHLDGRVAWVEQVNPCRGMKLRRLFERIDWNRDYV